MADESMKDAELEVVSEEAESIDDSLDDLWGDEVIDESISEKDLFKDYSDELEVKRGLSTNSKIILIACLLVLCFISVVLFLVNKADSEPETAEVVKMDKTSPAYAWCEWYLHHDFNACDVVTSDAVNLSSYYISDNAYTSEMSSELYDIILTRSADSINKIELENYNKELGTYSLKITYKPYKKMDKFDLDKSEFKDISEKYISGEYTDDNYQGEFEKFFVDSFNKCFKLDMEDKTFECTITEDENRKLEDVSSLFIPLIQKQGIVGITKTFEADFQKQLDEYSEEYL